jgi:hypothetical protein
MMGNRAGAVPAARPARWAIGAGWVAATAIGEAIGAIAVLGLLLIASDFEPGSHQVAWVLLGAVAGLLYGSVVGLAQWIVIRRVEPRARLWALAGMASWILAGVAFALLERSMCGWGQTCAASDWTFVLLQAGITALTTGALLSALLQWLILKRYTPRAAWWLVLLPAAMLPWVVGNLAGVGVVIWYLLQPVVSAILLVWLFNTKAVVHGR